MKNVIKLSGIIAFVAVIGFSMAACRDDPDTDPNNNNNNGGTFTLTGIPPEYNGKYAYLFAFLEMQDNEVLVALVGAQTINMPTQTITLPRISNGSVTIPMWKLDMVNKTVIRYSGNDTVGVYGSSGNIHIFNSENLDTISSPIAHIFFEKITFSNGSAAKAWSDGLIGG